MSAMETEVAVKATCGGGVFGRFGDGQADDNPLRVLYDAEDFQGSSASQILFVWVKPHREAGIKSNYFGL